MRIDNLSPAEKLAYEKFIKNQRIHQSEITTVRTDVEYEYEEKLQEERRQKEEAKAREEEERRQKEEAKAREEEERRQKEEAKAREEEERRQKEEAKQKLAKKMIKYGEPIEEIIAETGLTEYEINQLK